MSGISFGLFVCCTGHLLYDLLCGRPDKGNRQKKTDPSDRRGDFDKHSAGCMFRLDGVALSYRGWTVCQRLSLWDMYLFKCCDHPFTLHSLYQI